MSVQIHTGCSARGLHFGGKKQFSGKKDRLRRFDLEQFLSAGRVSVILMFVLSGEKTESNTDSFQLF